MALTLGNKYRHWCMLLIVLISVGFSQLDVKAAVTPSNADSWEGFLGKSDSAFTIEAIWQVGQQVALSRNDGFWVALAASDGVKRDMTSDLGAAPLAVTWQPESLAFFPTWNLVLSGLPELVLDKDATVSHPSGNLSVNIASTTVPQAGHTYKISLSYDAAIGAMAICLYDVTADKELVGIGLPTSSGVRLHAPASGLLAPNSQMQVGSLLVSQGFTPAGIGWQYRVIKPNGDSTTVANSTARLEPGDQILLDLNLPTATSGEWTIIQQGKDATEVLTRFTGLAGMKSHQVIAKVPMSWVGTNQLVLQYKHKGIVTLTNSITVVLGRVSVQISNPKLVNETGKAEIPVQIKSDHLIKDARLNITASIWELVWNPTKLRFDEVPVAVKEPMLAAKVSVPEDNAGVGLTGFITLPQHTGVWRIKYDTQLDVIEGVTIQVEGDSIVFDSQETKDTFTVMTYNLWAYERWPEREQPLRALIHAKQPDILCLQELRPTTVKVLDEVLPNHQRIKDTFLGWTTEGNIYWSSKLFDLVEYGYKDIGIFEPWRRLFWVRLRMKSDGRTILVTTAHYTWNGHQRMVNGTAPRLDMARRTVEELNRLKRENEPVLFMGDLNESGAAIDILRAGGLRDSFSSIGKAVPVTHPSDPRLSNGSSSLDWQLHQGPIRVLSTEAITFFHDGIAPSDHKPVMTTYGM